MVKNPLSNLRCLGVKTQHLFGYGKIIGKVAVRHNAKPGKIGVIPPYSFVGADITVRNTPHPFNHSQLIFRLIDLPAEQGDPCAMAFRLADEFEGITMGGARAAQYTDDH